MAPRDTNFKFVHYQRTTDLIKARLKAIKKTVEQLIELKTPPTPEQLSALHNYSKEALSKRNDFEKNLQRCLDAVPAEEAEVATLAADQDTICDLSVQIIGKIDTLLPATEPVASPVSAHSVQSQHQPAAPLIRLPKLELKQFSGDPLEWISFINQFNISIHRNASLPAVAKFQYLLSVLRGEPFNIIKSLPLSTANYSVAYDLLKERYHSPRRLVTLHLNQILDLPHINHSPKQMRDFVNSFNENTQALKGLDTDITTRNPLLSAIILRKMDNELRKGFEHFRASAQSDDDEEPSVLPAVVDIIKYLTQECSEIEEANLHTTFFSKASSSSSYNTSAYYNKQIKAKKNSGESKVSLMTYDTCDSAQPRPKLPQCFACLKSDHKVYSCPTFKSKDPKTRFKIVKDNRRCTSCLGNHSLNECGSKSSCSTCHKHHHSLLHFETKPHSLPVQEKEQNIRQDSNPSTTNLTCQESVNDSYSQTTVLLGTLLVKLTSPNGVSHVFRALADSGSQSCFLTEHAAQLLSVPRTKTSHSIIGLSQMPTRSKGQTSLSVETLSGKVIAPVQPFLILDKICVDLPRVSLAPEVLNRVRPYLLADPTFHLPGGIDVLLGGSVFPLILTQVAHNLGPGLPSVIGTHFGFMVMGEAPCLPQNDCYLSSQLSTTLLAVNEMDLHNSFQRFWQQEEPPVCSKKSEEDELCDKHFLTTHSRDKFGRYCVRLPFKKEHPPLGQSFSTAKNRLYSIERKFSTQPQFQRLYSNFMADYLSSGHMELAQDVNFHSEHFILPHHGILKDSGSTTRLRTVFDASAKTSNDVSLNQILLTGKKMQTNVCDLLLFFRIHNVVFSCDIRQMYRQIKMDCDDQQYQLILWREKPDQPVSIYKLTTVTYGVNCSPYLAIRTLHQLATDEGDSYPEAAKILRSQTFVDDILAGADTEQEALRLQQQLISLLRRGGFELRKWTSNSNQLLQDLPDDHRETPVFLQDMSQPHFTILGLHWSPSTDAFTYDLNLPQESTTKRQVLSAIAQIYDPCGFLSPIIMWAKCFMQLLWAKGLEWDQALPPEHLELWKTFISTSNCLREIKIERALKFPHSVSIELHGFADASEKGYAAVLYFRGRLNDGSISTRQIMSKTRVAPLKRLTIPRLELCAAYLLAQLVTYCLSIFDKNLDCSSITLWSDSTVTLSWLNTPPHRLKTFVANRVAQTQDLVPSHCWRHIASGDNPADCASRGLLPSELPNHKLWWDGPPWLKQPNDTWPVSHFVPAEFMETGEEKSLSPISLASTADQDCDFLNKFSHYTRLQHVMAYLLRFTHNIRHMKRHTGPLRSSELNAAEVMIFKGVQASVFRDDIMALKKSQPTSSHLRRLSPFLDDEGILRVGGRLSAAPLSSDVQHPVILPKRHHVVNILIDYYHKKYLHSGAQLTQSLLTQKVWILSARSIIRSRIFQCVVCFRHKPRNKIPLMGNLPKARVTPCRPFLNSGLDYGGPFNIKIHNLRSARLIKAYICIFVCLVTKAVHIEVVTDLTTDAFIAALTRFVSRRGLCKNIFSDCGTNFVGANNALQTLLKSAGRQPLLEYSAQQGINFHFNPPAAPHQGGLWEGAIKSAKHHLRRVIGEQVLTLSEFMTLTTQIEAILNSRPLTPLSNDPSDLTALSPGHFLVGSPLVAVPEEDLQDVPTNRLKHWQLIQSLHQRVWKRWHLEYLHTLQQRGKWNVPAVNLREGDLVLIHQPTPPLSWPLARITGVSPGKDGVVRVVHLKTAQGTFTRPAHKVFPLPSTSQ